MYKQKPYHGLGQAARSPVSPSSRAQGLGGRATGSEQGFFPSAPFSLAAISGPGCSDPEAVPLLRSTAPKSPLSSEGVSGPLVILAERPDPPTSGGTNLPTLISRWEKRNYLELPLHL